MQCTNVLLTSIICQRLISEKNFACAKKIVEFFPEIFPTKRTSMRYLVFRNGTR